MVLQHIISFTTNIHMELKPKAVSSKIHWYPPTSNLKKAVKACSTNMKDQKIPEVVVTWPIIINLAVSRQLLWLLNENCHMFTVNVNIISYTVYSSILTSQPTALHWNNSFVHPWSPHQCNRITESIMPLPTRPLCCFWHYWPWHLDHSSLILVWYPWLCSHLVQVISVISLLPC